MRLRWLHWGRSAEAIRSRHPCESLENCPSGADQDRSAQNNRSTGKFLQAATHCNLFTQTSVEHEFFVASSNSSTTLVK
jgi:hypothetical protein